MAKKFMYVCIGIMALAVTFHVGAMYGRAETMVDHLSCGIVAVDNDPTANWDIWALLDNGEAWHYGGYGWEHPVPRYDPPVPPSEIKFWGLHQFVTNSGELWAYVGGVWHNFGAPPMGPSATQPSTWGKIKAEWGE